MCNVCVSLLQIDGGAPRTSSSRPRDSRAALGWLPFEINRGNGRCSIIYACPFSPVYIYTQSCVLFFASRSFFKNAYNIAYPQ